MTRTRGRNWLVAATASVALAAGALTVLPAAGETPDAASADRAGPLHILPGHLIGADYEPDDFYVRQGDGDWEPTYTPGWQGDGFSEEVRGTLPNLRSANAIFDDESGAVQDHDPDFTPSDNTDEFIANLDDYKAHGLLATDVNLQGGNPEFDAENPAFGSDGSLRDAWMERAGRVIEASAERNMVVVLGYFYFHQTGVFDDEDAVRQATSNVTDWLIDNDYRNVVIEIANEHNNDGYPDVISSDDGMAELIELAQSRFDDADFRLAVGASRYGDGSVLQGAAGDAADVSFVHCNGKDAQGCADAVSDQQGDFGRPIVVNETDNTAGEYDDDTFDEDVRSVDEMVGTGASWGYMLNQWNQYIPCKWDDDCGSTGFDYRLGSEPGPNGDGEELMENFVAGVLEHLQSVVFASSGQN